MKFFCAVATLLTCTGVWGKEISITVLSHENTPVANTVVYLTPKQPLSYDAPKSVAIMDQVDTQFSPHILAVQRDVKVVFPNSDSIKHHVYSFSSAKTFELQLYKDLQAEPLLFAKPGIVELGCNIHDWMLGYIFVADTPYFAKTDITGRVILDVPEGEYEANVWHPRIQDESSSTLVNISIPSQGDVDIALQMPMLSDVNKYEAVSGEFSDYE